MEKVLQENLQKELSNHSSKKEIKLISDFYDNQQQLGFYDDTCLDNVRETIVLAEKYQKDSSVEAWCNCFNDLTSFAVNIQ